MTFTQKNHISIACPAPKMAGRYHVDWTIDQAGRHHWKFLGTGALVQAEGDSFVALRSDT